MSLVVLPIAFGLKEQEMKVIEAIKRMANEYQVSLTSKQLEKLVRRYRKDKLTYGKVAAIMLLREYFSILV